MLFSFYLNNYHDEYAHIVNLSSLTIIISFQMLSILDNRKKIEYVSKIVNLTENAIKLIIKNMKI